MEAMEDNEQEPFREKTKAFNDGGKNGTFEGIRDLGTFSMWLKRLQSRLTTWLVGRFRSNEYKFAFRVAILVTFAGIFGFLEETRELYHDWRGSWALFTVAVVSSSTVGASTSLGFWRTIGTTFGGLVAFFGWSLFPSLALLAPHLVLVLFLVIPITYMRLFTKYQRLSLVILVAFTIVFFGKYLQELNFVLGIRRNEPEPVLELFYKRTISIVLGVAISLLGTISIFPTFARTVLRNKCARLIQRLCSLYANVSVAIVSGISVESMKKESCNVDSLEGILLYISEILLIISYHIPV
jgi:uncharacterized membrane protein YccC